MAARSIGPVKRDASTSRKPSERQPKGPLRKGWTTGACATAAATAAYQALLTGSFPDPVTITLPKGQEPSFKLIRAELGDGRATAAVVKDAGDDPDVTHGAQIIVTVALTGEGRGISFHAGEGVGTVTRPGLALEIGEPAINPGPRAMMEGVIHGLARVDGCPGSVAVTLAGPRGACAPGEPTARPPDPAGPGPSVASGDTFPTAFSARMCRRSIACVGVTRHRSSARLPADNRADQPRRRRWRSAAVLRCARVAAIGRGDTHQGGGGPCASSSPVAPA